ncbi:PP2C family protein-serine/threonine phosphatase [Streptomyces sp. NPDC048710]|uniref:PP2C family protein-serine/threonine phosphatase n=1 Tax=Streptomyces sp. NPDC048710 TaxID=3365586 RepID=UPI00371E676E
MDQAVVVCDAAGLPSWCNAQAERFFPRLRIGEPLHGPLSRAMAEGADRFETVSDGRRLSGHRVVPQGLGTIAGHCVWLVRDDSAVHERQNELMAERARSAFLAEAGKQLGASLHHGRTVRAVVRVAVPALADTAILFLPARGRCVAWHLYGPDECAGQLPAAALDQVPPVAHALRGLVEQPVLCDWQEVARLGGAVSQDPNPPVQALVVTLRGAGMPAGVLVLARGPQRTGFAAADVELARQFASRASIALAAATFYAEQVHIAAVLQDGLEPDPLPHAAGVHLGAAYRPARETLRIGGDFYQVRADAEGGVRFFFGDVCGKGVEAAVFAGRVRQSLRSLALVESRPVRMLQLLNEALLEEGHAPFTTLVVGSASPARDGALDVVAAGGGHLPPLVLRTDGGVEEVHIGGTLVGALPDPDFHQREIRLAAGELLLLYSDGVTEARGGPKEQEMYGERRLMRDLAACRGMPAGAVAERIDLRTGQWLAGGDHDDLAVLAVQAPALAPPADVEHPR